jgi:hypothetical protein
MADIEVEGLNRVLRSLRDFPPEAGKELREEAAHIAGSIMVPSFQAAARSVPSWGTKLAASIRVKRDRVPAVSIGYKKRAYSGGASSIMVRFPTHAGYPRKSPAPFQDTAWIDRGKAYKGEAMAAYARALEGVVSKWNRGVA